MIAIAVIRLHLSSDKHELRYLFIVRHNSDSNVFSRQERAFSFRYRCLLVPSLRSCRESFLDGCSGVEGEVEADDALEGVDGVAGVIGIDITSSFFDIFSLKQNTCGL